MKRILLLTIAVALLLPATALGQGSSSCQAYNPQSCAVVSTGTNTTNNSLPFTGLNVGFLAAAGMTLLGSGFVIRRLTRRQD